MNLMDQNEIARNLTFCTPIIRGNTPVMMIEIFGKRMNELNSYKGTHFLSLSRTLESGVPIMSCILAIWSTSFEPGKRGWRLKETNYMYETKIHVYIVLTWITFTVRFGSNSINIQSKIMIPKLFYSFIFWFYFKHANILHSIDFHEIFHMALCRVPVFFTVRKKMHLYNIAFADLMSAIFRLLQG